MVTQIKLSIYRLADQYKLNVNMILTFGFVMQHSFVIKFAALFVLLLLNMNFLREFNLRRIPLFYTIIPALEILKFAFLNESYSLPHFAQFMVGLVYLISSLLLCWIIYRTVHTQDHIIPTINLLTVVNFFFSFWQIVRICFIEDVWNPYNTGHNHPYGISTGDLISGLFHGVHLTNAFVSVFLIIFHTHRKKFLLALVAVGSFLLTGNNYATIVYLFCMGLYFLLDRNLRRTLYTAVLTVFIAAFYIFVTPFNAEYMLEKILHISATLPNTRNVIEQETAANTADSQVINVPDTFNPYDISGATGKKVVIHNNGLRDAVFDFVKQSGKLRSYDMTLTYVCSSPMRFLFGAGMGGFSSKLAFNSSGIMEGSALSKALPQYETDAFAENHKAIYKHLKTQHVMFHSESNRPFSQYNTLLGEYGFVGVFVFVVYYLWYFLKRIRKTHSYALPVMVALLFFLNIDYFFEALSILLVFETLMFLDIADKVPVDEN